jgi:hypothetical protein
MRKETSINNELLWHFALEASTEASIRFEALYSSFSHPLSQDDWNTCFELMDWDPEALTDSAVNPANTLVRSAVQETISRALAEIQPEDLDKLDENEELELNLKLAPSEYADIPELGAPCIITDALLSPIAATARKLIANGKNNTALALFMLDFAHFHSYANQVALQIVTSHYDETGIRLKHVISDLNPLLHRLNTLTAETPRFAEFARTRLFDYRDVVQLWQAEHKTGVGYTGPDEDDERDDDDDEQ